MILIQDLCALRKWIFFSKDLLLTKSMFFSDLNSMIDKKIPSLQFSVKIFLCLVVIFCISNINDVEAQNTKHSAEILNVNYDKNKIDFSVRLVRPFDWRLASFVSKKTFPGNAPPWLPDPPRTRHRITWGAGGMFDWFQYDFIQLGNYQFTDEFTVRTELFGGQVIVGVFNPQTNTLLYDGLEYVPILPAPKFIVKVSEDMKKWVTIANVDPPARDSDNGDSFRLSLSRSLKRSEYISVDVSYE